MGKGRKEPSLFAGVDLRELRNLFHTTPLARALVVFAALLAALLLHSYMRAPQGCKRAPHDWPARLPHYERRVFSQNGEDGILEAIFSWIGTTNKYYVEFGTENGEQCNTRRLREQAGWRGLLMDGGFDLPAINLHKEFINPSNINALFKKHAVPEEFDLLSIDINFDDWWVWKAIDAKYRPRVVVIEYNAAIPLEDSRVIDPEDKLRWPLETPTGTITTNYWGASLRALYYLGRTKGYTLVACDKAGVNAFFVRLDILDCQDAKPPPLASIYVFAPFEQYIPEMNNSRQWLFVDEQQRVTKRVPAHDLLLDTMRKHPLPKEARLVDLRAQMLSAAADKHPGKKGG